MAQLSASQRVTRFLSVGVLNTLTDVAVFFVLVAITTNVVASNIVNYTCGAGVSFLLNRGWTFGDVDRAGRGSGTVLRFVVLNLCTLALSTAFVAGLSQIAPLIVAKGVSVLAAAAFSFVGMRFWVFGTRGCA